MTKQNIKSVKVKKRQVPLSEVDLNGDNFTDDTTVNVTIGQLREMLQMCRSQSFVNDLNTLK